jgi:hypothetical protein
MIGLTGPRIATAVAIGTGDVNGIAVLLTLSSQLPFERPFLKRCLDRLGDINLAVTALILAWGHDAHPTSLAASRSTPTPRPEIRACWIAGGTRFAGALSIIPSSARPLVRLTSPCRAIPMP